MSNVETPPGSSTSNLSRREKKAVRSHERAVAWRKAENRKFMDKLHARLEAKFALPEDFEPPEVVTTHGVLSHGDASTGDTIDFSDDSVTVPLPVPTDGLQLISSNFFDAMNQLVETHGDFECTYDQFIRIVQLQLLNKIYPPENESSECEAEDKTITNIPMPHAIQEIIDSAEAFEIPTVKVPNGALVRTHNVTEPPVGTIRFKPVLLDDLKGLPALYKSRFQNIMTLTAEEPLLSEFNRRSVGKATPKWLEIDAAAVRRLLAAIPGDAHSSWKVGDREVEGRPQTNYLLYGPVTWILDPNRVQSIYAAPVTSARVQYRLTGSVRDTGPAQYGVYSTPSMDLRLFESNFRRIMERSKVQKLFRDIRRVPLNRERSIFLKY